MTLSWWRRWFAAPARVPAVRTRLRPQLTRLEDLINPTVSLGDVSVFGSPTFESGKVTLQGTTTVLSPVGSARLVIDWADGSATQFITVDEGIDVPFTVSHVMLDDNPSNSPFDQVNINVRLEDTGPRTLSTPSNDGGKYKAYDIPAFKLDLANGLANKGAASDVVVRMNAVNNGSVQVPLGGNFTFYGQTFQAINITDNGLLTFNGTIITGNNTSLSAGGQVAMIAPYWDDLRTDTSLADRVLTRAVDLDGEPGNDYFIVEWSRVPHASADASQTITFQALLQLNTAGNGDIIFNYMDTTFAPGSNLNFGNSATIGIQSGGPAATQVQKGAIQLSSVGSDLFRNNQAVRFSTQDINIVKRVGPEGFGYNAFPMPFEANIDLQTAPQPPATTNGNKLILGGSGTFNDTSGSVATALSGGETLNVYGTVYDATFLINASDNGLLLFNGASNSPNNGDLATQPGATTLASLWDDWVGADGISFVFARSIDYDGDGLGEFLCVEWSKMQSKGAPDGDATWQTLIELNTGANDPADIYYNYRDTAVGDTFFDSGGRATVGLKDVGNQIGANARRLLISQDNKQAVSGSAFGIFQSTTPSRDVIITVNNVPPTIGAQENIEIPEGTRLTRTINFTDPSGQAAGTGDSFDYVITYGDGTDPLFDKLDQGTRSFVFDHVYADDGNYQVSLDLRDDDTGVASQVVFTVRVTNVRPALAITGSTRLIRPQQEVSFTDEPGLAKFNDVGFTYAPAGTREVFTYIIDWGDGTVQQFSDFAGVPGGPGVATTGSIFGKHTYLFGGEFVVQIKVADDDMQAANPNDFVVGTVLVEVGSKGLVVAGADVGGGPLVVAYNTRIGGAPVFSFFAYDPRFRGGVRVATADFNGDSLADIVTAPGPGGGPHIRVFDGATGNELAGFYAYDPRFTGGVYLATGDINNDGRPDIITGAGAGGGPHVRVFSGAALGSGAVISEFFAYGPTFTGGVKVASADIDGDLSDDIVTGPGAGGGPHVRVFSGLNNSVINEFFAYAPDFTGGVNVAAGDVVTGDNGAPEIITGPGLGGGPHVRVWSGLGFFEITSFAAFPPGSAGNAPPFQGDTLYRSGVYLGVADYGGDGLLDVIVSPGAGRPTTVRVRANGSFAILADFAPYEATFLGGALVAGL